ncbi:MAG TPA: MIP/aquaporin family protein [Gemmatimonadaceae bacterium]|jgi:glycerol uptake facilitator protein|nr:MIP/aquaporin family protein [Gemmatimonadaceae bacterium]
MSPLLAEMLGTMILVLLGDGVVANVVLKRTKGHDSGWIVITTGWALAVTIAVYSVGSISGAHLNPAVTLGLATIGTFPWANVPGYIAAQVAGAFLGGVIVWLTYLPHFAETEDPVAKLAVFSTVPALRRPSSNAFTELVGTFVLVLGILAVLSPANLTQGSDWARGFGPALVGAIVWSIGISLGGPTGYAINPARDLGPRLAHAALPIAGKGGSDWAYAWVPIAGPLAGGVLGALAYRWIWQ